MKNLYVGDLHGKIYSFEKAIKKFEQEHCDKLIFLGDYVDSYDYTNIEILHLLNSVIEYKKQNYDKVELLLGNHDWQYYYLDEKWFRCSGFRLSYAYDLHDMFNRNKELFKIAYKYRDTLAVHAGISKKWYDIYADRIYYYAEKHLDIKGDFDVILNHIKDTHDNWILSTIGHARGGYGTGGPLWADKEEVSKFTSDKRFKQIVGHNRVADIQIIDNVTFIDCLHSKPDNFLIIDHE